MIEESTYDELDRYVNGKMHGEELNGFMQKLDSDNALRNEVEWIRSTMIAMSLSGRTVMKQHVAAAMTGEVAKYSPAKNKKSFWSGWTPSEKKWWWIISLVAVAVSVALIVFKYMPQTEHGDDMPGTDQLPLGGPGPEAVTPGSDSTWIADSCAAIDSMLLQMQSDSSVTEMVSVGCGLFGENQRNDFYEVEEDTLTPIAITGAQYYAWAGSENKDLPMRVTLNIRKSPPFTYTLDSVLTLNSDYMCTKKMRFRGSGDTVIMTDSVNNSYILLRNRGKLPLVKRPPAGR